MLSPICYSIYRIYCYKMTNGRCAEKALVQVPFDLGTVAVFHAMYESDGWERGTACRRQLGSQMNIMGELGMLLVTRYCNQMWQLDIH